MEIIFISDKVSVLGGGMSRAFRICNQNKPAAQAADQTLPEATPPIGKIDTFTKMVVTFEPTLQFSCPSGFR